MGARDWFRALQVPVLPVSAGPAVVGGLVGARVSGTLDVPVLLLVATSLVAVQVGANLQKGLVESADSPTAPRRPRSAFVFDAGAVRRTGASDRSLRRVMYACYGGGAALGVLVVALTSDVRLLVFGGLGALLAFSYSGPPLRLSYRGVGEVSTFLAFGPITVLGAALAQESAFLDLDPWVTWDHPRNHVTFTVLLGTAMGALAALISFARYFPAAAEDRQKGKRTPVVRLGAPAASLVFLLIAIFGAASFYLTAGGHALPGPYDCWPTASVVQSLGLGATALVCAGLLLAAGAAAAYYLPRGGRACERAVALTVLLHMALSAIVALDVGPVGPWLVCS